MQTEGDTMTKRNEVARLGDGDVFVKRTPDGTFCAVKGDVSLTLANKEFCSIPGGGTMITAAGYDQLNKVAGLTIIYPPRIPITVNRRGFPETAMVENPYIEYDDNGVIKVITTEALAIGLSPIGNWVITQERLRFDLNQYFVSDAWSKVKRYKNCGKFINKRTYESMEDKDKHVFLRVMGEWGLALDISHEEVMSILTSHLTRQKFAERIATTICRRNAMKRHPAISKTEVVPKHGEAVVTVYGWQHDMTAGQVNKMVDLTMSGQLPPEIERRRAETEVEFGSNEIVSVASDVEEGDLDRHRSPSAEKQKDLFEKEDDAFELREKVIMYLGKQEQKLGERFREALRPFVERIDTVFDLNELTTEELDEAARIITGMERQNEQGEEDHS